MDTLDLKYRPKTYEEVIGQELAKSQLQGELVRSYILEGPSGTGKSTLSRVFANGINADVIELDTASLGKADIEDLKQTAYYSPMFFDKKVIILDEVHNLSKQAWDSLLKVIEEGPDFTLWMLVTTEPSKVPKTIQTRSRRITLTKVNNKLISEHLVKIVEKEEHEELPESIIHEIVAHADGGVREAIKLLETYLTTGEIDVRTSQKDMIDIIKAVYEQDYTTINRLTEEFSERELEMLIKVISDYITMIVLVKDSQKHASPGNNVAYEILDKHTSINPTLLEDLRDMQMSITNTFEIAGNTQIEQTVNALFHLMDTLMRHYNMFHDKKATTRGALNWVSSQLQ